MKNYLSKYLLIFYYLFISSFFFVISIGIIISSITLNGFIFGIWSFILLTLPIILTLVVFHKNLIKYLKILLIFFLLLSINIVYNGFQKNNFNDKNYNLVCIGCSENNFNILNNLTEKEYLNLGFNIGFLLQLTNNQINSFKDKLLKYEKIEINLPTQVGNAILNIKQNKYISYIPNNYDKKKAIFIIHGNAGGFLFYQKYFKDLALENNTAILEPVFGWGNWDEDGGTDLIFNTYKDLVKKGIINKYTETTIIGLSNGGKGLSRVILNDKKNVFKNVIYISAVIEKEIYTLQSFKENIFNKKVYFLHGALDDRVFLKDVEDFINFYNLKNIIFPSDDHFLMIVKDKQILDFIKGIIK